MTWPPCWMVYQKKPTTNSYNLFNMAAMTSHALEDERLIMHFASNVA